MQVKFRFMILAARLHFFSLACKKERRTLGGFPRKALESGSAGGEVDARKCKCGKTSAIEGSSVAVIPSNGFMRVLGEVRCGGTECRAS